MFLNSNPAAPHFIWIFSRLARHRLDQIKLRTRWKYQILIWNSNQPFGLDPSIRAQAFHCQRGPACPFGPHISHARVPLCRAMLCQLPLGATVVCHLAPRHTVLVLSHDYSTQIPQGFPSIFPKQRAYPSTIAAEGSSQWPLSPPSLCPDQYPK
jgi:hypothetical protein